MQIIRGISCNRMRILISFLSNCGLVLKWLRNKFNFEDVACSERVIEIGCPKDGGVRFELTGCLSGNGAVY